MPKRLFILACLFTCIINAQQNDTITKLDEVILIYRADSATPVTFTDIPAASIEMKSTGQEPSFILAETPSVTAYSDGGNTQGYSYFRMRGIDQTRINISLDGVPLNEPEDQGAYFSNYPDILNSVSRIHIQRGVGTSKNGTASYGGSVQLFSPDLSAGRQVSLGAGYGSFNSLRLYGEYNSALNNNKALYARVSYIASDGYKYNSSNKSQSVFVSAGWFKEKSQWKVNFLAGHQKNELAWLGVTDSLIAIDRRTNANHNENDNFTQALVQVLNKQHLSPVSSLQASIYYTFLDGDYDFDPNNYGYPPTEELFNYAFLSNLGGFFSNYIFSKRGLTWTSGIHGNVYSRRHRGSERTAGTLYENTGYKNEASAFTKAEWELGRFNLFTDLQYRHTSFNYTGSISFDRITWNFFNPKAGISFNPRASTTIYYSIGSTKREPTRNDMFGGNDDLLADESGNALLFNTIPEKVVDHELGIRMGSQNKSLGLNAFLMDFEDEIVLNGKFGPNGIALTNNVRQSIRTGLELCAGYTAGNFSFINNSSYIYSHIKEQRETFSPILTPKVIINQEIRYSRDDLSISLSGRYQDKSFIDFANSTAINSYILLNSRVSYAFKGIEVTVFINNITNEKYFNNGYVDTDGSKKYFVQAPINYYLFLKYTF